MELGISGRSSVTLPAAIGSMNISRKIASPSEGLKLDFRSAAAVNDCGQFAWWAVTAPATITLAMSFELISESLPRWNQRRICAGSIQRALAPPARFLATPRNGYPEQERDEQACKRCFPCDRADGRKRRSWLPRGRHSVGEPSRRRLKIFGKLGNGTRSIRRRIHGPFRQIGFTRCGKCFERHVVCLQTGSIENE